MLDAHTDEIPAELLRSWPAPAAGAFDGLEAAGPSLRANGWMLHPTQELDSIVAFLDGRPAGHAEQTGRPDVGQAVWWVSHAGRSGFTFQAQGANGHRLDLIGMRKGQAVARLSSCLPRPPDGSLPLPPDRLTERVAGVSAQHFRTQGLKTYSDLLEQLVRHGIRSGTGRMLDWGCGCGRLTRNWISRGRFPRVHGCDIDGEAIEWCRQHLQPGEFRRIDVEPPTPYEAGSFDLVTACSVFTHLSAADQARWLRELHRILAPGGLLLASTNGEQAYRLDHGRRPGLPARLLAAVQGGRSGRLLHGILDRGVDRRLDGIAPSGYYRAVYQSREHTVAAWSEILDVVDYVECGMNGHQDLVVLRRA